MNTQFWYSRCYWKYIWLFYSYSGRKIVSFYFLPTFLKCLIPSLGEITEKNSRESKIKRKQNKVGVNGKKSFSVVDNIPSAHVQVIHEIPIQCDASWIMLTCRRYIEWHSIVLHRNCPNCIQKLYTIEYIEIFFKFLMTLMDSCVFSWISCEKMKFRWLTRRNESRLP